MAEQDETAATAPPHIAEHHDSTIVQPPREEEEEAMSPIRPESGEQPAVRPKSTEDDATTIQPESEEPNTQPQVGEEEEEPPLAEEDAAATTRPGSGEENAVGSDPVEEEDTAPIDEENAVTAQPKGEKAKPEQPELIRLEFPTGRVKKIMKLDADINKINSEALHLVTCSAQLFLQFLAEGSGEAAMEKKRKIVKLEHIRTAAKRHRATRDFLVDELPAVPGQPSDQKSADRSRARPAADKPAPAGTRRIDDFFSKPVAKSAAEVEEA
ncbi:transcription regulator complex subunit bur6 [Argentina anserina]|uniref:transcription regulator complex subunit bur6 n=1 Tax=Argentina anserina TaxID=57926 RepID=UPI00217687B7|nr:transcription regulator complex subunit bur6 [Potentilla anserina]